MKRCEIKCICDENQIWNSTSNILNSIQFQEHSIHIPFKPTSSQFRPKRICFKQKQNPCCIAPPQASNVDFLPKILSQNLLSHLVRDFPAAVLVGDPSDGASITNLRSILALGHVKRRATRQHLIPSKTKKGLGFRNYAAKVIFTDLMAS